VAIEERRLAIEAQGKFEFYFVALVFTVLGLAIQTTPDSGPVVARVSELLGWLCLFGAGLAGLSRLEWTPVIRVSLANQEEASQKLEQFRGAARSGQTAVHITKDNVTVPIEERIERYQSLLPELAGRIDVLQSRSSIKYKCLKGLFVAGVVLLMFARGLPVLAEVASASCI
jgi:hypothetical protein